MANKTIVDFTEKTTIDDSDLMLIGNKGTSSLRKITWANIIKTIEPNDAWFGNGKFVSLYDGTIAGAGHFSIIKISPTVVKIDFSFKCTANGTSSSIYGWGIDRDLLKEVNSDIPTIKPMHAIGNIVVYNSDGTTLNDNVTGYGAYPSVISGYETKWCLSRVYDAEGNAGAWPEITCEVGRRFVGTCYGTIE